MILQRGYREGGYRVWRDYLVDGKVVKSPVDIEKLPWGKYQLVDLRIVEFKLRLLT